MDATPLELIARWAGGTLASGDPQRPVSVVCTDSRTLQPGDLFVALVGERFDAHSFVSEAARLGAGAALVSSVPAGLPPEFGVIEVGDTLRGLQQLSAEYRRSLGMRVIGITGSNGKTSTKDLTAAALAQKFQVTKTEGNFNNHIGVPLSLLRARGSDEIGVIEVGMNHAGEIAPLAALALPEVAIITNIGVAHIEYLGSREGIAQEKGMLAEALPGSGTLIMPVDDDFAASISRRTRARTVFAGLGAGEVQATHLRPHAAGTHFTLTADGQSVEAELPVPGEHMVRNATLAAAAARVFGVSLEACAAGFAQLRLTKGRVEQKLVGGIQVLDDSYNANPDSMAAALRTLAQLPVSGRRIAVLGGMGELGHEAESGHRRVGEVAAREKIDCVITVGERAEWIAEASRAGVREVVTVPDTESAGNFLRENAKPGDLVLIKGSRSAKMERVLEALQRP